MFSAFRPLGPISYTFSPEFGSQLIVAQVEDHYAQDYAKDFEDVYNKKKYLELDEVFGPAPLSSNKVEAILLRQEYPSTLFFFIKLWFLF